MKIYEASLAEGALKLKVSVGDDVDDVDDVVDAASFSTVLNFCPNGRPDVSYHLKKGDIAVDETNGPVLNNVSSCNGHSL